MEVVVQFALLGAATGGLVALVALGVVISYRASGVLNLAIGAVGASGAFVCYSLRDQHDLPTSVAVAAGIASGTALGALTQWLVVKRLRNGSNVTKLIGSLGMLLLVQGSIDLIWPADSDGTLSAYPRSVLPTDAVHITDGIVIGTDRIILGLSALAIAVALGAVLKKTLFGLATTAVAEERDVAAIGGWSASTIELVNFVIAGTLASAAMIFIAPITGLQSIGLTLLIIPAVAAALVGSFTSLVVTVGAAVTIGVLQAELSRFQPDIANWLGFSQESLSGLPAAVPMMAIIVFTVWSGRLRSARGDLIGRQPLPGDGRIRLGIVVPALAVMAFFIATASPEWSDSIGLSLVLATLVLSVIVVTGFAGQLSLAQFALAGFGAWVAAKTYSDLGTSFGVSLVLAVVLTVPVGLLVALPALRTRGVTLAIATLGFAIMLQALVFNNGALTGGVAGISVPNPTLFGVELNPIGNARAYNWVILASFVLCATLVANMRRGRTGRRLLAVRSNERAAASLGAGIYGAKLYAFGVAAGIAALSGVLLAFRQENILFNSFTVFGSFTAVQYAILGGIGWVSGAPVAGLFAAGGIVQRLGRDLIGLSPGWIMIFAGVGILFILRHRPDGIASGMAKVWGGIGRKVVAKVRAGRGKPPAPAPRMQAPQRPAAPTVEPATLDVRRLTVRFGGVAALTDVSLRVSPGEVLGLIGPNGAGKTTLMDAVTGFTKPDSGAVALDGQPIDRWTPERRARAGIGRSWQAVELFNELSVLDNLLVASDHHERWRYVTDLVRPGKQPWSPVMWQVVADFQLEPWLDQLPPALPHGIQRLVGIARAICAEPAVLLLDEPTAGLDRDERAEVGDMIRRIARDQGIGILLVEHDVPLVMRTCDRIVVLDFGSRIAEGPPEEITQDARVVEAYLGDDRHDDDAVGAVPEEGTSR